MFFCVLYLISALSISAVAAYFSVIGLATIFPGSMASVVIMGGVLEIGKIVTAIWLHRNWKSAPLLVKSYLSFATLVLMGITSMGIFGFLSRAHIEHETNSKKSIASVSVIDGKIQREQEYILRQKSYINELKSSANENASSNRLDIDQQNQKIKDIISQRNKDVEFEQNRIDVETEKLQSMSQALSDLENSQGGLFSNKSEKIKKLNEKQEPLIQSSKDLISQFNENIKKFRLEAESKIKKIEEEISLFRSSSKEKSVNALPQIEKYSNNISESYAKIDKLEAEKVGLEDSSRQLEAEVGPVKYVAEAIADFTGKDFDISQAVRIVIIILVLVFDPLAILLVIAANISLERFLPKSDPVYKKSTQELNKIKLEIESRKKELDSIKTETADIDQDFQLKFKNKLETESEIESKRSELKDLVNKIKNNELEISIKKAELDSLSSRLDTGEENLQAKSSDLSTKIKSVDEHLDKISEQEKSICQKEQELQDKINKQRLISQKLDKDQKEKESNLKTISDKIEDKQSQLADIKNQIDEKAKIAEGLKNALEKSLKINNIKTIFSTSAVKEMTQEVEGLKNIYIKDSRNRIHHYKIPKEHSGLSYEYLQKVTAKLEPIDDKDLPYEYQNFIKAFVSYNPPEYNFLTSK